MTINDLVKRIEALESIARTLEMRFLVSSASSSPDPINPGSVAAVTITGSTLILNSGNVTTTLSNGVSGTDIQAFNAVNNTFSDCFATIFIGSQTTGNPRGQFQCGSHGGAVGTLSPATLLLQDTLSNTFQVQAQVTTTTTASAGAATLPANPDHFLVITQNGSTFKIPCYLP